VSRNALALAAVALIGFALPAFADDNVTNYGPNGGLKTYQGEYGARAFAGPRARGFQGPNGNSYIRTPRFRAVQTDNGTYVNGLNRDYVRNEAAGVSAYRGPAVACNSGTCAPRD